MRIMLSKSIENILKLEINHDNLPVNFSIFKQSLYKMIQIKYHAFFYALVVKEECHSPVCIDKQSRVYI